MKCQLAFKEKFNNNKLSYKTYVKDSNYETSILSTDNLSLFNNSYAPSNIPTDDVTSDKTIKTFSEHDTPENELEKLGYKYDEEKKTYTKKIDENTVIKNMISNGILIISNQINNHSEIIKYYYSTNRVNYSYSIKDNINIECFDYNVPDNLLNCIKGDCKNYHIKVNYILDVYRELTQTLQ